MDIPMKNKTVFIIGSGYVGLPLAFVIDHTLPIADRDTRESPVREIVKELKEF
jgi:UDP-N-acetyl-D-mannosaminuronate dehydrogenase